MSTASACPRCRGRGMADQLDRDGYSEIYDECPDCEGTGKLSRLEPEEETMALDAATALRLLLERVDYTAGACKPSDTVGAMVSYDVLQRCHEALERERLNQGKKPSRTYL